ncbi:hypothetical protein Egran_02345 [Elaphomyces granulatus]|uniref:Probable 26S proteasome regulatory subunit p27 n=1 Tax=Elaphomyces granulatus TaxID=519963 RepID=A0A232M0G4_9EURO|nr:hypothetical protein Egran_02345 [Elaphomyces granulatus]
MGLPMDNNIHAPTVPSGPTTTNTGFGDLSKLSMVELMDQKERIESELSALSGILSSHGVDMNTSLTTPDGFPRNDIDVAQIRTTRVRIIHLRNDHKEVMKHIEKGLHAHFAALQQNANATTSSLTDPPSTLATARVVTTLPTRTGAIGAPFAKVNSVVNGSPADSAGLKMGDAIRYFGYFGEVNWVNHEHLSWVSEVVQQNEGRPLEVRVVRRKDSGPETMELSLELTPRRNWGGRGLLGCHLVPL